MVNLHTSIQEGQLPARMITQVHDELVFEVPEAQVECCADRIREAMASAIAMTVPMKIDVAWGRSWLEGKTG